MTIKPSNVCTTESTKDVRKVCEAEDNNFQPLSPTIEIQLNLLVREFKRCTLGSLGPCDSYGFRSMGLKTG